PISYLEIQLLSGVSGGYITSRMNTIVRGAHLHFEVRTRNPSRAGMLDRIDPVPLLMVSIIPEG
ncbi:hypothetical protein L2104_25935, partial [Citrobacter braakii]|uniref:hypothetical protein n=1 Tax=Citrobacter braakii TaxID=57706 RepID=UPI0023B328A8